MLLKTLSYMGSASYFKKFLEVAGVFLREQIVCSWETLADLSFFFFLLLFNDFSMNVIKWCHVKTKG